MCGVHCKAVRYVYANKNIYNELKPCVCVCACVYACVVCVYACVSAGSAYLSAGSIYKCMCVSACSVCMCESARRDALGAASGFCQGEGHTGIELTVKSVKCKA